MRLPPSPPAMPSNNNRDNNPANPPANGRQSAEFVSSSSLQLAESPARSGASVPPAAMLADETASADVQFLTREFSLSSLVANSSSASLATSASSATASVGSPAAVAVRADTVYRTMDHAECTLGRMQDYLDERQLCDVTLIAGIDGTKVPAHRIVLSASSAYFAAMFTGSLRETQQTDITLGGVPGDALRLLVRYCYTGAIGLREDTVETVLATACLLQLNAVVMACSNFLCEQLHASNCIGFALFAEQQSCAALLQKARSFTHDRFLEVCKNQEFLQLGAEQLAGLLASDELHVHSEQDVFEALMEWTQHEMAVRERHLPDLLGLVRLPLLTPGYIADHVETHCTAAGCQQLVMEALKWHLMPERRALVAGGTRTRPRKSTMGKLLAVGGMDAHKGAISIESYCPRLDRWTMLKNMNGRRLQFGVALMEDKLIIVGGRDGLKTLNSVDSLDLNTMAWSTLGPMATHRHGLGVAVLEGPLYAVGGHDGWSYLNTVERWDPAARTWSYVAPMASMRSTAGVAVLNGRLYVVGGRDGSVCHRSVEVYDPHTNKWTMRSPMNKRRGGVGVGVANGYLYALGGHDCPASNPSVLRTETVERYDPGTDTWTMIASLSIGRDAMGVALLGGCLIAVGGYDGNQYLKTVEQFDPETNEWKQLSVLNFSRAGACVIAVPNQLTPAQPTTVQ